MPRERLYDPHEEQTAMSAVLGGIGDMITARPAATGWAVAGMVAFAFVSSNALFFQSGQHPSALFNTRAVVAAQNGLRSDELASAAPEKDVTRIVFDGGSTPAPERAAAVQTPPATSIETIVAQVPAETPASGDNALLELQQNLAKLGFYEGDVDGITGPKTREAIENYKASVGLRGIELTTAELVISTGNNLVVTAAIPKVRPVAETAEQPVPVKRPEQVAYTPPAVEAGAQELTPAPSALASSTVARVQAGLRAFGNTDITVDGVSGEQTRAAIREFQSLFRLPVTGQIDDALVRKMESVGLIN